jgi:hypothetical protein
VTSVAPPATSTPPAFETGSSAVVADASARPDIPVFVEAERVPDAPRPPSDQERIRALLDAYTAAYERLDAVSAASLWPGVDTRALTRAFSTLSRQDVSFNRCDIGVAGTLATARCQGVIEYVPRVGETTPQSRTTAWVFALDRRAGEWRITNVSAR